MLSILRQQRDDAANAYVEMAGRCAEWEARWNDPALVSARLAELVPGTGT